MTPEALRELVRAGESLDVEFEGESGQHRATTAATKPGVVLVLPGGKANLDFVRLVVEESQVHRALSLDDLLILNHVGSQRQLRTAEAAQLIQKPEAEARRRLQRLVEAGLVQPRGGRPLPALAPARQGSAC